MAEIYANSIEINEVVLANVETTYNPNATNSIVTKNVVNKIIDEKNPNFIEKHLENILYDKDDIVDNVSKLYKYTIADKIIISQNKSEVYIPEKFYDGEISKLNTIMNVKVNCDVGKIIVSNKLEKLSFETTSVQNIYFPNLNLNYVSENCFYILSHELTYKSHVFSTVGICKGLVLGKNFFEGMLTNKNYGNFSNVEKIFIYNGVLPSDLTSRKDKKVYVKNILGIENIYFYDTLNDIHKITYSTTTEYENKYHTVRILEPGTINIDRISEGKEFVLELSEATGNFIISRDDESSENLLLKEVYLGKINITVTDNSTTRAFDNCGALTYIDNCCSSNGLFKNCLNLSNLKNRSTTIGSYDFYNCQKLSDVAISTTTSISDYSFYNCGLTSIVIPSSVSKINDKAFDSCSNFKEIYIKRQSAITFTGTSSVKPGCKIYVCYINMAAAKNYFGESCEYIELFEYVYYRGYNPTIDFSYIPTDPVAILPNSKNKISGDLSKTGTNMTRYVAKVVIDGPNTLKTTDNVGLFENCIRLTSVSLSTTVKSIEAKTFYGCSKLSDIVLPTSLTNIAENSFTNCSALSVLTLPPLITTLGNNLFSGCVKLVDITIPDTIETIGDDVFNKCTSLSSIDIPSTVTNIGKNSFAYCSSLTSFTLPTAITTLEEGLFISCVKISDIEIPDTVKSLGSKVFYNCTSLSSIDIPTTITSFGTQAFASCSSLEHFTIPTSITRLEKSLFSGCSKLVDLVIPTTVKSIGETVFYNCSSLTTLSIPDGVDRLEYGIFGRCQGLISVFIPSSVTFMNESIFTMNNKLESVTCLITENFGAYGVLGTTTVTSLYVNKIAELDIKTKLMKMFKVDNYIDYE